ncbi:NAD(P)/FAD-dependent oxidoreductase [Tsukamurella soli]|uniref:FAD-dependent oxidoreductase n=1 Tax=Tsukamurella soli TaxID=644556 RepID=A0ABP8JJU7_9ACTN
MTRVVIVGASLAGVRCATALRAHGLAGEVVLVGDESYAPYDRPPLSKAVLAGRLGTDRLWLPAPSGADTRWLLGAPATALAPGAVLLADGRSVGYDRLVIATGVRARRPAWAGPDVHLLRGIGDAERLRSALTPARRVLVVGGGFTGCEVASSCRDRGLEVTLVHRGPAPLSGALGTAVGSAIADRQRARGTDVRTGVTVVALGPDGAGGSVATLSDGSRVAADVVVAATGSEPNTSWLDGAGLAAGPDGVDCAPTCHALDPAGEPLPDVFAIGDVARWEHPLFGAGPMRLEHWGNAVATADTAARGIVGSARPCAALPAFWSDQFGMNVKSVGLPHIADSIVLTQGSFVPTATGRRDPFVVVYGRAGVTVGAVAVNSPRVLDGYAALVAERAPFPPPIGAGDAPASAEVLPFHPVPAFARA